MKNRKAIIASILRSIARYTLLVFGVLIFLFALMSGAEGFGGGIRGIIKNGPNAVPWLLLVILVVVAWKWELVGGILITLLGLFALGFFGIFSHNVFIGTQIISLIPVVLGSFLILSWYLSRGKDG
jgi:hypothetical protein